jgi:lysophospholipase L1-like esterase
MRRQLLPIACLLVATSALAGGAGREPIRVLLVGDSITAGVVSEPKGPSYAQRLGALLGDGYAVTNIGVNGTTSEDWTTPPFDAEIESNMPARIASLLVGSNDAVGFLESRRIPPEEYGAIILRLAERLAGLGAERVILMTPPPIHYPKATEFLIAYRDRILSLCWAKEWLVCGPDLYELLDRDTDFEEDNVHPNAGGHGKIAEALARTILSLPDPEEGDERPEARPSPVPSPAPP